MNEAQQKLIVALDVASLDEAKAAVDQLGDLVEWFKVGSQLFTAAGPEAVRVIKAAGAKVFLDLKFHDIPTTVSKAIEAGAELGADIINVHTLGGARMLRTAAETVHARGRNGLSTPALIGVTVLTCHTQADIAQVGLDATPAVLSAHLALMAKSAGLNGVVASPHEVGRLRERFGHDFLIVTPGVRPTGVSKHDQCRTTTPGEAIADGADHIVVGRPIMEASNSHDAAKRILDEIETALV